MNFKTINLSLALASVFAAGASAQTPALQFPAPSPLATVKQRVGLTDIEITYSRPSVKSRKIFGSLVPYGSVWRTGANQSTKLTFSTPVKFNGVEVPAGTYALYTIPGANEWTVIIYKNTALGNVADYDSKDDAARIKVKPVRLSQPVESFTIDVNDLLDESATLSLSWDRTRVPIKLEVDVKSRVLPQIEAAMAATSGTKPYYQAASFYYDHGLDLQKARQWAEAAVAEREAYFTVHLKAKILAKLGDKSGALAAANKSLDLATTAKDAGYIKLNKDLIASLK
jgi:hypothetical protein